jgi:ribosomal protein S18 acetylase RimI-like enzyme
VGDPGAPDGAVPEVRPLREDELDAAAQVLGRAFLDDPLLVHALPDYTERRALAAAHFTPVVRHALQFGEVRTAGGLAGVACWRHPGRHDPTDEELADSGLDQMAQLIGRDAEARLDEFFEFLHRRRAQVGVPERHWYLAVIGVDPDAKGNGIGTSLLRAKLAEAAQARIPVFLETAALENVAFYERNGMRCIDTGTEPVSGLGYWMFLAEW